VACNPHQKTPRIPLLTAAGTVLNEGNIRAPRRRRAALSRFRLYLCVPRTAFPATSPRRAERSSAPPGAAWCPAAAHCVGGFLPSKKSERIRRLEEVKAIPATLVFYETPHRIEKALADALEILGNRKAAIARELTKLHEEIIRGDLSELFLRLTGNSVKGEIVLVIDRISNESKRLDVNKAGTLKSRLTELESEGFERKAALKKLAKEFGLSRSEVYRRLLIE